MPASSFSLICGRENCSPGRRGDPKPGHSRNKVIFHLAAIKHIIAGLMANSEESQTISQGILQFQEERSTGVGKPASTLAASAGPVCGRVSSAMNGRLHCCTSSWM